MQNLVFPEGLSIMFENREYLTGRIKSIFDLVLTFMGIDRGDKKIKIVVIAKICFGCGDSIIFRNKIRHIRI